jgi:hypothetical protein
MSVSRFLVSVLCFSVALGSGGLAAERWRFIMTADSRGGVAGVNEQVVSELAGEILKHGVDLVIVAGDLVYGARVGAERFEEQLWNWVRAMQPVYDAGVDVYVCRGNHEIGDMWDAELGDTANPFDNYALTWLGVFGNESHPRLMQPDNGPDGERYFTYSTIHKNALIVGLDNYAGIGHQLDHRLNQEWLDAQLLANRAPHVFVFGHEPAFRTLHFDCLDAHPQRRDAFWRSLEAAGARVYLCGHDHFYDHARVDDGDGDATNDIHQLIVGTAGAYPYAWMPPYDGNNSDYQVEQIYHADRYGYVLVEVDDLDVSVTWMERRDNNLLLPGLYEPRDVWAYTVAPDLVLLQPNGHDRVIAGQASPIRWRSIALSADERVRIDYSLDEGATWIFGEEVDNVGAFVWQVPPVRSAQCLVKVRSVSEPLVSDTSDAVFCIYDCPVVPVGDLNHDCYVDSADLAILASQWLRCANPLDPACGTEP